MTLQAHEELGMVGLGVLGDVPPDKERQPALKDGVHLRWGLKPERGFPLHGFHLFRRPHRRGTPLPLSSVIGNLQPGRLPTNTLTTPRGEMVSDVPLLLTDDFPPSGIVEFDLQERGYLRFELPEADPARRVEAAIGFRKGTDDGPAKRECVSFTEHPPGNAPNPMIAQGVVFKARDRQGSVLPHTTIRERQIDGGENISGLDCAWSLEISLPRASSYVELRLAVPETPAEVEALREDGTSAGRERLRAGNYRAEFRVGRGAITRVVVKAHQEAAVPANRTLLHQLCFEDAAPTSEVQVTALSGSVPLSRATARGRAGQITSVSVEGDSITAVEITPGPAALVDLGLVPLAQDATEGWELVPDFPYPLRLPITHPDYPCTPAQSEDLEEARELAEGRILYGDPPHKFTAKPPEPDPERDPGLTKGTVSVVRGSPIVEGSDTDWKQSFVGTTLHVIGDLTAYGVVAVITKEKLVLSRGYGGSTDSGKTYKMTRDYLFAELHDQLAHLLAGGGASGPMHERYLPVPVHDEGTISPENGSPNATGSGTNWDARLVGLQLRVREMAGTVSVTNGSPDVEGSLTNWKPDLIGQTFEVAGEQAEYTIENVETPTRLKLDRPYEEDTNPSKAYAIVEKAVYTVQSVDTSIQLTLDRPYEGTTRSGRNYAIAADGFQAEATEEDAGEDVPSMSRQYPLDMILLSTLHPALAQIIGLYWVDEKAKDGVARDYLLVADYDGRGGLDPQKILEIVRQGGFAAVDGYIVPNQKTAPAPPLPAPKDLRVYSLPGAPGDASDAPTIAGLRWDLERTAEGELLPDSAILYHLWRAELGKDKPSGAPPDERYLLLTKDKTQDTPLLVAEPDLPSNTTLQPPAQWPKDPMHTIDGGLSDGWHSYRMSGIDIFGRHSPKSAAGQWFQWEPPPDPLPWYWETPPDDRQVHPFAIEVRDRTPPPPPTGVEAYALDPEDPTLLKDAAHKAWWDALTAARWYGDLSDEKKKKLVGLRVRWLWTESQRQQAPDTREFRIYYHRGASGQMNALPGKVREVRPVSAEVPTESIVETDIANTSKADAYAGAALRIGQDGFAVLASEAVASGPGEPPRLRLRVRNVGPQRKEQPPTGAQFTLTIPPLYSEGSVSVKEGSPVVTGDGTNWPSDLPDKRSPLVGEPMRFAGELAEYAVVGVDSPSQLKLNRPYAGTSSAGKGYGIRHPLFVDYGTPTEWAERYYVVRPLLGAGARVSASVVSLDGDPDLSGVDRSTNSLFLENDKARPDRIYRLVAVDNAANTVTVDGAPDIGTKPSPWIIGPPGSFDVHEVFLPAPDGTFRKGLPLAPKIEDPVVYAHVGVSAADDKDHALDDPKWEKQERWGNRPGNEGRIGSPAKVFRVLREEPKPPEPPPDAARVFATAADYHGRSYYTYRWRPVDNLKTHIFRALDEALFKVDWLIRTTRTSLNPTDPQHEAIFPNATSWDLDRKQAAASELNAITSSASYASLSSDARNILARLPGNEDASGGSTLENRDWAIRTSRKSLVANDTQYFPGEWNAPKRQTVAAERNAVTSLDAYRSLSNDGLRVLAALPGNERAFIQLTIQPLDPNDPDNADRRGPDSLDDYKPSRDLRAYEDTLDGRSTNRYFYRAAYVDGAHNRGELSLSSPPVYLPNVVPPRTPVITKVAGGERQITLSWTSNREPDLAEYRVYRADSEEAARNLRLMTLVHTEIVPAEDPPIARPAEVTWTDTPVPGLATFFYRLVAVDDAGNASPPSSVATGRAFDEARPAPPTWNAAAPGPAPNSVSLRWTSAVPDLRSLVQRRIVGTTLWENVSRWLESGLYAFVDSNRAPGLQYVYRLRVMDVTGKTNNVYNELTF